MPTPDVLEKPMTTEGLPLDLKLEVERLVLRLCQADNNRAVEWIERYNGQLHEIIQNDEEVKSLALERRVEEAAALAKEKLEEWYGHDVSL